MNFWKNKKDEIENIITTSPKSYVIYLFSFSIFIFLGIIFFFLSPKIFIFFINMGTYFFMPPIIIAFLMDAKWLIFNIAKSVIGRWLLSLLAFIAYTINEILSKKIIYFLTSTDPELFTSSIKLLAVVYFIPSWVLVISSVAAIIIVIEPSEQSSL